jgi:hypothetical protein
MSVSFPEPRSISTAIALLLLLLYILEDPIPVAVSASFLSISPIVLSVHSHNAFKGSPHTSLTVSFDNDAFLSRHVR